MERPAPIGDARGFAWATREAANTEVSDAAGVAHATPSATVSALRSMSWSEREARAMLERVRGELGPGTDVMEIVRRALKSEPVCGVREDVVLYQRCA